MATCLPLLTSPSVWCSSVDCRQYRCRCHWRPGRLWEDRQPPLCEVVEVARGFSVGASVRCRDPLTMPTCWVQALRQPHTATATSAQLLVTAPSSYGRGRRRAGCVASRDVVELISFGWDRLRRPQTSVNVLGVYKRYKRQQAGSSNTIPVGQSRTWASDCGLRKNCTCLNNQGRNLNVRWVQFISKHNCT